MPRPIAHSLEALCLRSRTPEESRSFAAALGRVFREIAVDAGLVVSLRGELGAGKTVFVKGLAEGLGLDPGLVSSPTFVLANEYPAASACILHHVDLYRLEGPAELETMGFFDLPGPGALVAVEWGDRFADQMPTDRLDVHIVRERIEAPAACGLNDPGERLLEARATGPRAARVLEAWRATLRTAGH
ncbi:MAG: tRNA (adenosine(37)-N6)-threonylcarbamoyltransferase complex ATPase subunit type 1 TsaE [Deltaproteobacteria bacterium]|nr:tRNA (adenosine(37)-N6)-threonylcarbamoyltransferase complex ATPase subunit type 1 TsaE [Deltaproteobacteria bacterium]